MKLTTGNEFPYTTGEGMTDKQTALRFYLEKIAGMKPPKRYNRHDPKFWAQKAMVDIATGEPVAISEAAFRYLPWQLKTTGLNRIRGKGRANYFLFNPHEINMGVKCAFNWLLECGWQDPTATCKPTLKGQGKSGRVCQ